MTPRFLAATAALLVLTAPASANDAAALFAEHCAACHGASGEGVALVGPALSDDDWIWGGDANAVLATIAHGVRNEDPLSRQTEMPRFGADGLLEDTEIAALAAHLLAVSEGGTPDAAGADLYANHCATCHGEDMEGQQSGGAPRLSDRVWLFGGTAEEIAAQIADPQHGVMPGWSDELGDDAVRLLADYVRALARTD